MANPFLITDTDMGDTQVSSTNASFNPFLAGNDFGNTFTENPFMNVFASSEANNAFGADNSSTNPFAFGSEPETTPQDIFSQPQAQPAEVSYDNIFSSPPKQQQMVDVYNDFSITSDSVIDEGNALPINEDHLPPSEAKTSGMYISDLGDQLMGSDSGTSTPKTGPPRRPPPPRPVPPKETKDLILSVTGAMEATSSHLLDRLQATRTPSPTPMRDLHSPSPTQFGDLLEVDEPMGSVLDEPSEPQEGNLLGDFDFTSPSSQVAVTSEPPVEPMIPMDIVSEVQTERVPSPVVASAPPPVPVSVPPSRPAPPAVPGRPKPPPQPSRPPPVQPQPVIQQEPQIQPPAEPILLPETVESEPPTETGFADVFGSEQQVAVPKVQEDITFAQAKENIDFQVNDAFSDFQSDFDKPVNAQTELNFEENANVTTQDAFASMDFNPPAAAATSAAFNIFDTSVSTVVTQPETTTKTDMLHEDDFDAFTAKFENAGFTETKSADPFDPFSSSPFGTAAPEESSVGFGAEDNFDSFLALREPPPVPQGTPARISRGESAESDGGNDFNIFIKPKVADELGTIPDTTVFAPLAPPPKSPVQPLTLQDTSPRFNPFDSNQEISQTTTDNIFAQVAAEASERSAGMERTDSHETPPTPLFDEDVSQPLEDFPRIHYEGPGWEMQLRQPNKKKITGQRFWKKISLRLVYQGENPVLQLFNNKDDKDPFQELPLQPCYSVSEIGAQQYDQYGKIFTVKLQFIFYKERPGVRPGQVTKAERITNKLSQFAAYAIQGDYQGVKEFGSDLKKLGLPVEHAPQISQLFKIGSHTFEDMKQFSMCVEEALFRLAAHRDRALNYKMEEVQITAVDELYVEQNSTGGVEKQIARVRLFFLGFLSGMPDVELGVNDLVRQGKEVVGRHDIIPVVTEEWIRLEGVEFHSCVQLDEYEKTRTIRFKPPDACYIELMRFRVRPPRNRELPLQLKCTMCVTGNKVDLRADILVPGFTSRKLGQIPCEDVMVRIPIPECWIYLFRVEKHFRYGSVKSAHRRTGKIKGIERILGAVDNLETSLMEVTSGQAKYEHQHRAIVWRMPRLPKEGQGAYTTHNLVCRMALTSYDQIPEELAKYCYVEFTMPATTVSHTTVRSVSIANSDSDSPPEKYVRQLSRHEYRVEIEHTQADGPGDYIAATVAKPAAPTIIEEAPPPAPAPAPPAPDSDSDSSA